MKNIIYRVLFIVASSSLIFIAIRPTFAELLIPNARVAGLTRVIPDDGVIVGVEIVDGYQQVYYELSGERFYATQGNQNSYQPVTAGEYLAWVSEIEGAGQIFLLHIPTDEKLQLTTVSTNINPDLNEKGWVTWEKWVDETWQVFVFNKLTTQQISQSKVAIKPIFDGEDVLFAHKGSQDEWIGSRYITSNKQIETSSVGAGVKLVERVESISPVPITTPAVTVIDLLNALDVESNQPTLVVTPITSVTVEPQEILSEIKQVTIEDIREELQENQIP